MRKVLFCSLGVAVVALFGLASRTQAYETWTTSGSDNCAACHGAFTANGYIGAHDRQAWSVTVGATTYTSLHNVHRRYMLSIVGTTSDCQTCHTSAASRTPVLLSSSGGGIGFQPLSCLGCHGRPLDGGAGLRQHHFRTGTADCLDCHDDADPGNYTPVGENIAPSYYFTPDAQHPTKPTNPCNPGGAGENVTGGPAGLDNDGDTLYDSSDPDCQVVNPCAGFTPTDCTVPGQQGACAVSQTVCDPNTGEITCPQTVEPVAETCNGVDDDCDGSIDNLIPGACNTGVPGPCANGQTACQGGAQICQQTVPPAAETCNGIDDNCDGTVDNITPAACTVPGQVGPCANGQTACQAGAQICQQTVQPVPETPPGSAICQDTIDNDCDGTIDLADTGCQFTAEANCFDGIDNNGDGRTDCADPTCANAIGPNTTCGVGACAATGNRVCQGGVEVNTCTPGTPTAETCNNMDDNCDGMVDNITPVACTVPGQVGPCANGETACQAGAQICQQTVQPVPETPPGSAICRDAIDNDCDGTTDAADAGCQFAAEADCFNGADDNGDGTIDCADPTCANAQGPATTCGIGACAATGNRVCQGGVEVNTCASGTPRAEICDGIDNDCDGQVDNGIASVACDTGLPGICAAGTTACVNAQSVCNQTTPAGTEGPFPTNCADGLDNDCDGLTDTADPGCAIDAENNCFDGVDNNSDGRIDCADPTCANAQGPATTCGVGACAAAGNRMCQGGVELDTCTPGTPRAEACDGIDNDCDGQVDNGIAPVPTTCGTGICAATGQAVCQNGQLVDNCTPGIPETEVCNNLDDDCNGVIDDIELVVTTCGVGACETTGRLICQGGSPVDTCTPLSSGVEGPFASSTCTDGIDNDCDTFTDAADPGCAASCAPQPEVCDGIDNDCNGEIDDGLSPIAITCGVGPCQNTGERVCLNGVLADQCTPLPAGQEGPFDDATCADGIDNNCNSLVDAADPNCQPGCEPAEEVCDGVDNDCNDVIDDIPPVPTTCGMGACANSGELVCQNGVSVDTCMPLPAGVEQFGVADTCADNIDNDCDALVDAADPGCAAPPAEQACFDSVDNDGDGLVDCVDPDCAGAVDGRCDTGLAGLCAEGDVRCANGAASCVQLVFPQPEICADGLDNDCDGLTDAADPDCQQVQICHAPGSNLTKVKLITVEPDAVQAHLRHGDFLPGPSGTCQMTAPEGTERDRRPDRRAGKD